MSHAREGDFTGLDRQVNMIRHQAVRDHVEFVPLPVMRQPAQIALAIGVISEDRLALISANDHVVQRAGELNPWWPGHLGRGSTPNSQADLRQVAEDTGAEPGSLSGLLFAAGAVGWNWHTATERSPPRLIVLTTYCRGASPPDREGSGSREGGKKLVTTCGGRLLHRRDAGSA